MMLDADVQISCEDLKFSLTSWQSSQDSMVGFFPRLHRHTTVSGKAMDKASDGGSHMFEFLDHWSYVWYNKMYSLLLPAGVVVHRRYLEDLHSFKAGGTEKKAQLAGKLHDFLEEHNECAEMALNVWVASAATGFGSDNDGEQPPVWLDISKNYANSPAYKPKGVFDVAQSMRKRQRSKCLTDLATLLDVKRLPTAVYKSVQAKTQLWW